MKKILSLLLGVGALGLALTSCEDEFTEEDALALQQENLINYEKAKDSLARVGGIIQYTVQVIDGSQANVTSNARTEAIAPNATVTVIQNGDSLDAQISEEGTAFFGDLRIGVVTVRVEAPDYTTVVYTADITPEGYDTGAESVRNASTPVFIFPITEAAGAAVVTGKAEIETNLLNDEPELAVGATVRGFIDVDNGSFKQDYVFGYNSNSDAGRILSIAYVNDIAPVTVGDDGTYRLIVPAGIGNQGNGLPIEVEFDAFETQQVLVREGAIDTVDVLFGTGITPSAIPTDAGVMAIVPAPPAAGTGLSISATSIATTLTAGTNFDVEVLGGGAGYLDDGDDDVTNDDGQIQLVINPDDDNSDNVRAIFNVEDGKIISFDGLANAGAEEFSTMPEISSTLYDINAIDDEDTAVPTTQAQFTEKFESNYQLTVDNGGENYIFKPSVRVKISEYSNMSTGSSADGDLEMTTTYDVIELADYDGVELLNGSIVTINDEDITYGNVASLEIVEVVTMERRQAEVEINVTDGEIDNIILLDGGSGYDPNTELTVSFSSVSGMGTGAAADIQLGDIDTDGEITDVNLIDGGSDYLSNANDQTAQQNASSNPSQTLKPGQKWVYDFNYGVGKRVDE